MPIIMKRKAFAKILLSLILVLTFLSALVPAQVHALFSVLEEAYCTIDEPLPGGHPSFKVRSGDPEHYAVEVVCWWTHLWEGFSSSAVELTENDVFEKEHLYSVRLKFTPKGGYTFAFEESRFFCNGFQIYTEVGQEYDDYGRRSAITEVQFYCRERSGWEQPADVTEPESPLLQTSTAFVRTAMVKNPEGVAAYVKPDSTGQTYRILPFGQILEITGEVTGTNERFLLAKYRWSEGDDNSLSQILYIPENDLRENVLPTSPGVRQQKIYPEYDWGFAVPELTNVRLAPDPASDLTAHPLFTGTEVLVLQEYRGYSLVWYSYEDEEEGACSTFGWVPALSICRGSVTDYVNSQMLNPAVLTSNSVYYVAHADQAVVYYDYKDRNSFAGRRDRGTIFSTPKNEFYYNDKGEAFLRMEDGVYISFEDVQEWKTESYMYGKLAVAIDERAWIYPQAKFVRGTAALGRYNAGDVFTYYGIKDGYLMVVFDDQIGWVPEFATHLGKQYDYDKSTVMPPLFLAGAALEFEKNTPVYFIAKEDDAYLLGTIYDGYYSYQGTVDGFYKIEYMGEAGFVPKRFCLTDPSSPARVTNALYSHEWGGAPLANSIFDRYYVTTAETPFYSDDDSANVLGTFGEGEILYGNADCSGTLKQVLTGSRTDPVYVEPSKLQPTLPEALYEPFMKTFVAYSLPSKTVGFREGEALAVVPDDLYSAARMVGVREVKWTLRNGAGEDVTAQYADKVKENGAPLAYVSIEKPDGSLDGGVAVLSLVLNNNQKACQFFFLAMCSSDARIPALNVQPKEDGSYAVAVPDSPNAARFDILKETAGKITVGGVSYDASFTTVVGIPEKGYTFDGLFSGDVHFVDADGQTKLIGLQNLPGGGVSGTILRISAPKNVKVTGGPTVSKQVTPSSATDRGSAVVTVTAEAKNATGAAWYAVGKTPQGSVVLTQIESGEDFSVTSTSDGYSYIFAVYGESVSTSFDSESGKAILTLSFDDYSDWADMPIDDIFFCVFEGEESRAVTDPVHLPNKDKDGIPLTDEEKKWLTTVAIGKGIQNEGTDVDLEQADLSGIHVHDFRCETVEGDCETGTVYRFSCSCGEDYEYTVTGDHAWGVWETVTMPTLEKEGVRARHCTKCGKAETQIIEKLTDADGDGYDDTTLTLAGPVSVFYGDEYTNIPGDASGKTQEGWPLWLIILAAVLAFLLVGGIVILIILIVKRKKSRTTPPSATPRN